MADESAVRIAIDLLQVPSRVRMIREAPLPDGMELLLRIAAGERAALEQAKLVTGRPAVVIGQAAAFFIEQILLSADADSYRVLGSCSDTPSGDLRRNMALLARWLHPDVIDNADRSLFAGRVTHAWDNLKTPQRRAAYDYDKAMGVSQHERGRPTSSTRSDTASVGLKMRSNNGRASNKVGNTVGSRDIHRPEQTGLMRRAVLRLFGWARP